MTQIRCILAAIIVALGAGLPGCGAPPGPRPRAAARAVNAPARRSSDGLLPPPAFTDPARRAKLASAFPAIDAALAEAVRRDGVPGFAFGIVIDGELVHAKGLGVRDRRTRAPVDEDTVFRIAWMTKSFTAMALLQLRDAGKLALDDPAERYLPDLASLPYPTRDSAPILIDPGYGALRGVSPRRVAAEGRRRDRPAPPELAPRDADRGAALGPPRRVGQPRSAARGGVDRLWIWPLPGRDVRARLHRPARGRAARVQLVHAALARAGSGPDRARRRGPRRAPSRR